VALATMLLAPAAARAALPPQGLYEECAPSSRQQCAGELQQIGSAGFRLALNYTAWYGRAADLQAYASDAQAAGVKLIWPLNYAAWRDPGSASTLVAEYPGLAADCGCQDNASFVRYAIGLVRSFPATWGYYVGDELNPSTAPQVAELAGQVRALDAGHQLLYVGQSFPSVPGNLQPFLTSTVVIGADVYPVGEGMPVSVVGNVAAALSNLAGGSNARPAMELQAFSWSEYPTEINAVDPRWPTETEMRAMRNYALLANPSMILWYNLSDIQRSDAAAQHWRDLVAAAFAPATASAAASGPGSAAAAARAPRRRHAKPRRRHAKPRRHRRRASAPKRRERALHAKTHGQGRRAPGSGHGARL
jgi:hypothetical protein